MICKYGLCLCVIVVAIRIGGCAKDSTNHDKAIDIQVSDSLPSNHDVAFKMDAANSGSSGSNLLNDSSFESDDGSWLFFERDSYWKGQYYKEKDKRPPHLNVTNHKHHSGDRALVIGPYEPRDRTMSILISQYVEFKSVSKNLKLEFWSHGGLESKLKVIVDISYKDTRRFVVQMSPKLGHVTDVFHRTCILIPDYGDARALMIHFVLESSLDHAIYIDDVSIASVTDLSDGGNEACPVYTDSFPQERQVSYDFLTPSDPIDVRGITLVTQLTLDRLDMLERISSSWRGPITAVVLLFKAEVKSGREALEKLYRRSKDIASYVTFHVVDEDAKNSNDASLYPANFLRNLGIAHARTDYVFYIDVDMVPSSPEAQTRVWIRDAICDLETRRIQDATSARSSFQFSTPNRTFPRRNIPRISNSCWKVSKTRWRLGWKKCRRYPTVLSCTISGRAPRISTRSTTRRTWNRTSSCVPPRRS